MIFGASYYRSGTRSADEDSTAHPCDVQTGSVGEEGVAEKRSGAGSTVSAKKERPYSSRSAMMKRTKEQASNPLPVKPPNVPKPRVFRGTVSSTNPKT